MAKDSKGHGSASRGGSSRAFDHGELNIPLAKRQGNINAQLDRYKADQKRASEASTRAARERGKDGSAPALAKVAAMSTKRLAELGKPHGLSASETRTMFRSMARTKPDAIMRMKG